MFTIIADNGLLFCTDSETGEYLYELEKPSVIFILDRHLTVVRLGDKSDLEYYYEKLLVESADSVSGNKYVLADLPSDVEELNRLYNNSGYLPLLFSKSGIGVTSFIR
jgi:hypothetical protein